MTPEDEKRERRERALTPPTQALTRIALEILDRPWRPEASTAQPPIVCGHDRAHIVRAGGSVRGRCSLCGHARDPR